MRIDVAGLGVEAKTIGNGPVPVLFVHGLGADSGCFAAVGPYFPPERYTLILPDLPGFGRSDAPDDYDYKMESLAKALGEVLASLGHSDAHVVAHSMGGAVALLLCELEGFSPRTFTSAEGNLVAEDAFMSSKISRLKERAFERVFSKWLVMARESLGPRHLKMHDLFMESLKGTRPLALHRASVSCMELTRSGKLEQSFAGLACPRQYLIGELTAATRDVPAPVLAHSVPVETIAQADHFLMDNEEAFYMTVKRFIEHHQIDP